MVKFGEFAIVMELEGLTSDLGTMLDSMKVGEKVSLEIIREE